MQKPSPALPGPPQPSPALPPAAFAVERVSEDFKFP